MLRILVLGIALLAAAAATEDAMQLSSTAFRDGSTIPVRHTADGADLSPPLAWSGAPPATRAFVLIVDDPDAPDPAAPRTTWVHWVLFNLPPTCAGLPEGGTPLPAGTGVGLNDARLRAWRGPSPPIGIHRYIFKLYALDLALTGLRHATKGEVESAMAGHILAEARLTGLYGRR